MTDEQGAILEASICPFGRMYRNPPQMGATVLVQGVGVAGLSFIQAVKCFGAKKVIAAGRNPSRLDDARRFGADVVVNVKERDLAEVVRAETGGLGVDLSIDAAGAVATFDNAIRLCAAGGVVHLYGLPQAGAKMALPVDDVIFRQLTIRGGTNNELAWVPLMDLIAGGKFNNADMVTHRFGFDELPKAIDLVDKRLQESTSVRIVCGENETTRFGFKQLIDYCRLGFVQPDITRCGGITEAVRIASYAEVNAINVVPHCWSSGIVEAASLQIIASIPNAELLEYCEQDTPIRHDLVPDDIPAVDGYAAVPTKPGLGIEVSDEAIEFYRCDNY